MDLNTAVLKVSELQKIVSEMSEKGMEYALIEIQAPFGEKEVNFEGITHDLDQDAVDFGALTADTSLED